MFTDNSTKGSLVYIKLKLILRIITYLVYICWEIDHFVIKSDIWGGGGFKFKFNFKYILKIIVLPRQLLSILQFLSVRRGFLHACIF